MIHDHSLYSLLFEMVVSVLFGAAMRAVSARSRVALAKTRRPPQSRLRGRQVDG
jgi:hypothetical protein